MKPALVAGKENDAPRRGITGIDADINSPGETGSEKISPVFQESSDQWLLPFVAENAVIGYLLRYPAPEVSLSYSRRTVPVVLSSRDFNSELYGATRNQ